MKIQTTNVCPPIPTRSHDWTAVDADTYDGQQPVGHGATEAAAIQDLMERLDLRAVVVPLPNSQRPWGVAIGDELYGYSKSCFDCDYAANVINERGLVAYEKWSAYTLAAYTDTRL